MRKVPVDLLMLPAAFESHGENEWYLDLESGDVLPVFDDPELEEKIEDDPDRFLPIEPPLAGDDFRVMEDFVAGLPPGEAKRDLERVLRRAKPFRNFREALRYWPAAQEQWFALRDGRMQELVRKWLAENDIEPVPRAPNA
jgi:hypothetical protein